MKQMVTKILPEVALSSSIPSDAAAKKMAHLYKEQHLTAEVLILSFGETGPALNFLQNVTKAIDSLLAPAKLIEMRKIERENSWELTLNSPTLQLILAPPFQAWKSIRNSGNLPHVTTGALFGGAPPGRASCREELPSTKSK